MGFFDNVFSIKINNKDVKSIYEGDKLIWPLIRPSYFETFTISSTNIYVQDSITISFRLCGINSSDILKNQPVQIYDGNTLLTTQNTVNGTGLTTYTYTIPDAGTHNIKLIFEGNDNYKEVISSIIAVTVNKSNTNISWTASSYTGEIDDYIGKVTVKDRSNRLIKGITVEFYQGSTKIRTATTNSSGQCSGPSFESTGTYTIYAKVIANANYNASTSNNVNITINKKDPNLIWRVNMPTYWIITPGEEIIVSASVVTDNWEYLKIYNNDTLLTTAGTYVTGVLPNTTVTPTESGTIKVVFEGNDRYNAATISKNIMITVSKYETKITDMWMTGKTVSGYLQYKDTNGDWLILSNKTITITDGVSTITTVTNNGEFYVTNTVSWQNVPTASFSGDDTYQGCSATPKTVIW